MRWPRQCPWPCHSGCCDRADSGLAEVGSTRHHAGLSILGVEAHREEAGINRIGKRRFRQMAEGDGHCLLIRNVCVRYRRSPPRSRDGPPVMVSGLAASDYGGPVFNGSGGELGRRPWCGLAGTSTIHVLHFALMC